MLLVQILSEIFSVTMFPSLLRSVSFPISLASREMQIRTTLRFHLKPVKMPRSKTPMTAYAGEDVGNAPPLLVGMQTGTATLEIGRRFLRKLGKLGKIRKIRPSNTSYA